METNANSLMDEARRRKLLIAGTAGLQDAESLLHTIGTDADEGREQRSMVKNKPDQRSGKADGEQR